MQRRNPNEAFDHAIASHVLSADETADNYAGLFMYMRTETWPALGPGNRNVDWFKHADTREYLRSEPFSTL